MKAFVVASGLTLLLGSSLAFPAKAFPPSGSWDAQAMDSPVRPTASIGAVIAAAEARVNARGATGSDRRAGVGPGGDPMRESCSLQVGSVNLPSRGTMAGQTVVTNADVRGTIIQICR